MRGDPVSPNLVERAAVLYLAADPYRPTAETAEALGISRGRAGRLIMQARKEGLLPATETGRARQYVGAHRPRRARFGREEDTWLACHLCHMPWPCDQVGDSYDPEK